VDVAAKPAQKLKFSERDLARWKLVDEFRERLDAAAGQRSPGKSERDPRRKLLQNDYFSLVLFALLNPVVDTMRGICEASHFGRLQEEVCRHSVSLGSFSEAQAVVDLGLLQDVFLGLSQKTNAQWGDPRLAALADKLIAVDGTLLRALPRMHWALWQDENNRAGKLHLKFNILGQVPMEAVITAAKTCERAVLRQHLKKGEFYVADRYYGLDYGFFAEVSRAGASFVFRICNDAKIAVEKELAVSEADRAAGVIWDGWVKLGVHWQGPPVRLVKVQVDGHLLLLVTDQKESMAAELVALIYKSRWQIELFFKWIKCILGCRHLLAESLPGMVVIIYCALIASLLLMLFTGRKPNRRAMEAIRFYLMGYATLDELCERVGIQKNP
jgi:hypothetical protein